MRNQRAGQATFIPLDTIQVKPVNDKYRSFAKGARLAVDVIQYDPAIERAVHHACGTALVCDTMEIARYICYEKSQEVKGTCHLTVARRLSHWPQAVTLDGTIIHKSGLITGGRSRDETEHWTEQSIKGPLTLASQHCSHTISRSPAEQRSTYEGPGRAQQAEVEVEGRRQPHR